MVGPDDVAAETVGVNPRSSTDKPRRGVDLSAFVDAVVAEVADGAHPRTHWP